MSDNLVYEPRAFWQVESVTPDVAFPGRPVTVQLDRENFRNGTRNPITLTKVCLAPVGYTMADFPGVVSPPAGAADFDNCAAVMQKIKLFISAPGRQNYQYRPQLLPMWGSLANGDVSMFDPGGALHYSSGLLNLVKWRFDRPMIIPRGAIAEFQLGSPILQPVDAILAQPNYSIAFFEDDGLPGGSARVIEGQLDMYDATGAIAAARYPYAVNNDGLGVSPQGNTLQVYPQAQYFTRDRWRAQQQTQAGSTKVTGFSVAIRQADYDDDVQNTAIANVPGNPVAPLSLRTPVGRARLTGAGSEQEWWREDIPLALLGATLGPAQTFELSEPITLHPGDALDLEMTFPGATTITASPSVVIAPTYQMGISFLGMSAIAG